jgi:hypothetical protein
MDGMDYMDGMDQAGQELFYFDCFPALTRWANFCRTYGARACVCYAFPALTGFGSPALTGFGSPALTGWANFSTRLRRWSLAVGSFVVGD